MAVRTIKEILQQVLLLSPSSGTSHETQKGVTRAHATNGLGMAWINSR
jgi:orotidine-5'-phosphate decarboxylase